MPWPAVYSGAKTTLDFSITPVPASAQQLRTEVLLSISARNLPNHGGVLTSVDPICHISIRDAYLGVHRRIGRTEGVIDNFSPDWKRPVKVTYSFHEQQSLLFEIYDFSWKNGMIGRRSEDFLGRLEISLSEIVGSLGGIVERRLNDIPGGKAVIRIMAEEAKTVVKKNKEGKNEEVKCSQQVLYLTLFGINLDKKGVGGKSDPFLLFHRTNTDGGPKLVHRTETVKQSLNPQWKPMRIPLQDLCFGDPTKPFEIVCMDCDPDGCHDLIGICTTTVDSLLNPANRELLLVNESRWSICCCCRRGTIAGRLNLIACELRTEHSFLDYIRGGTQLNFSIAIDFTASNGDPASRDSLHHMNPLNRGRPQWPNEYELALLSIGSIIQHYNSTKKFPAFGFGAQIPPLGRLSHCFHLNFEPDPNCSGVEGVLRAYRSAIAQTTLAGPRHFAPVINRMANWAEMHMDGSCFFVLLIVTDGIIDDVEETKAAIVRASFLPMVIIIVGVGSADFSQLYGLTGEKKRLTSKGREADGDIVRFVPMLDFLHSPTKPGDWSRTERTLAAAVLTALPIQLTAWMRKHNVAACPPLPPPPPMPIESFPDVDVSLHSESTQLPSSTSSHRSFCERPRSYSF